MLLTITSTTGSPLVLTVPQGETVEGLKARVAQHHRVHTDKIVLLHKDRQLTSGKLLALGVANGSTLTLVPVAEAGLPTIRCDRNMMDALDSLTEDQISAFLSGRSPLNIIMGIGAHVMYVQLQLSEQDVAELVQKQETMPQSNGGLQAQLSTLLQRNCSASSCSNTNKSMGTARDSCISLIKCNAQKPGMSLNLTTSTSHLTDCDVNSLHHSYPTQTQHAPPSHSLAILFPSESPHPCSPLPAATPICTNSHTGSSNGPPSPVPASTFTEGNVQVSSSAKLCKQSGAVIDSFVSHTSGVFSGTFSGTLAPHSQSQITHPRPGVAIIVQILTDLLRAASVHKGALANLSKHHCPDQNLPAKPQQTAEDGCKPRSKPNTTQSTLQFSDASGGNSYSRCMATAENQMLHYKLEHLQFLMNQKRLHRQTRRSSHPSRIPHPYRRRDHCPSLTPGKKTSTFSHGTL